MWVVTWQSQKPIFNLFCICSLICWDIFCSYHNCNFTCHYQVALCQFLSPFYILLVPRTICEYFEPLRHICIFFYYYLYVFYVYVKCFCIFKWAYLVFLSIYLVLVYCRYTNANIGSWWVTTWVNIFSISKHSYETFGWNKNEYIVKYIVPRIWLVGWLCFTAYQPLLLI